MKITIQEDKYTFTAEAPDDITVDEFVSMVYPLFECIWGKQLELTVRVNDA